MPLTKSKSKAAFKSNLKAELAANKPKAQALAIAFRVQREAKRASGGGVPFYERAEARGMEHAGMIHSPVAGRTDKLPMGLRPGSYVIPADTVSSVGQGNSLAGAHGFNKLLGMGPFGSQKGSMPRATPPFKARKFANGGDIDDDKTGVIVAGGEFIVPPEKVAEIGGGDLDHGHAILDEMVKHIRSKTINTLKKLPGPVQ